MAFRVATTLQSISSSQKQNSKGKNRSWGTTAQLSFRICLPSSHPETNARSPHPLNFATSSRDFYLPLNTPPSTPKEASTSRNNIERGNTSTFPPSLSMNQPTTKPWARISDPSNKHGSRKTLAKPRTNGNFSTPASCASSKQARSRRNSRRKVWELTCSWCRKKKLRADFRAHDI